jgi:opacity protein-like surface antigen
MRKLFIPAAAFVLLAFAPAPARAQAYIAPFYGWDFGGSAGSCPSFLNDCSEKKSNFGVTLGYGGLVGIEEDISYAPNFFGTSTSYASNSVLTLMTNISIGFPTGPVRPYVSGGIGLVRTNVELTNVANLFSLNNSSFGYDLGAGVNLVFPHHLGVRLDYRNFRSTGTLSILEFLGSSNHQHLNYSRFAIGLLLH